MLSKFFYALAGLTVLLIGLWFVLGVLGKAPVIGGAARTVERLAGHPA